MPTPLYNTDIIPLTSRPTLTVMDDGDYFVILDTSTGKISKILRTNAQKALNISYNNATSGLTATQVQGALDELVVNLGSSDSAISAIKGTGWNGENLVDHETRLDTTELTLARQGQDLASVKQTLQQGNGATLDFSGIGSVSLDARATGRANPTVEGLTATNIVSGAGIIAGGTVTFSSVLNHKYFDVLHDTILTGTGSDMTVTNDTGATKDIAVIYLTGVYGLGNEPSATDCAKIFSYFDGTKSIQLPARLRSVGRNLFDGEWERGYYSETTGVEVSLASAIRSKNFTHVEGAKTYYYRQFSSVNWVAFWFYDSDKNYISRYSSSAVKQIAFTTPPNCRYVTFAINGTVDTTVLSMLNLGSTALPYEPYTDSTLYIADNEEVRSVPAISDEVKVINGQVVKVGNVQRYVLSADDIYSITDRFNVAYVRTKIFADNRLFTKAINNWVIVENKKQLNDNTIEWDIVGNTTNSTFSTTDEQRFLFFFPKGTTLAEAKTALAGTVIYYQLATPIITPLLTSGTLQAFQNGSVYFEPYYEGSHQTDASGQITLPYEGTIDKLTGYDENLEPYEVPSTGYTLVGTTLTITGAVENEVYYVELSRSEPLAPEMSVNVLNNEQVIADTSNGKFYKLVPTITDGVLVSQTPVEVV